MGKPLARIFCQVRSLLSSKLSKTLLVCGPPTHPRGQSTVEGVRWGATIDDIEEVEARGSLVGKVSKAIGPWMEVTRSGLRVKMEEVEELGALMTKE